MRWCLIGLFMLSGCGGGSSDPDAPPTQIRIINQTAWDATATIVIYNRDDTESFYTAPAADIVTLTVPPDLCGYTWDVSVRYSTSRYDYALYNDVYAACGKTISCATPAGSRIEFDESCNTIGGSVLCDLSCK